MSERDLDKRIKAFLQKKTTEFPEIIDADYLFIKDYSGSETITLPKSETTAIEATPYLQLRTS